MMLPLQTTPPRRHQAPTPDHPGRPRASAQKVADSFLEVMSHGETASERSQSVDFVDLSHSTDAKNTEDLGHQNFNSGKLQESEQPGDGGQSLVAKFLERTPEVPTTDHHSADDQSTVRRLSLSRADVSFETVPRISAGGSPQVFLPGTRDPSPQPSQHASTRAAPSPLQNQRPPNPDFEDASQMFKTADVSIVTPVCAHPEEVREALNSHQSFRNIAHSVSSLTDFAQQSMEEIREHLRELGAEDPPEVRNRKVSGQTHANVMCQGCLAFSIRGKRFVCLKCPSLNLCAKCEKKTRHPHPMLRVVEPIDKNCALNLVAASTVLEEFGAEDQAALRLRILRRIAGEGRGDEYYRVFLERLESLDLGSFIVKAKDIFRTK